MYIIIIIIIITLLLIDVVKCGENCVLSFENNDNNNNIYTISNLMIETQYHFRNKNILTKFRIEFEKKAYS